LTYDGSASAVGMSLTLTSRGAPLTDTPLDIGGPTAQAAAASYGSSVGYAAFPDPGPVAVSGPGLATGLIKGGVAGAPPIPLPFTSPDYPLYVQATPGSGRQRSGSGPYVLSADSTPSATSASATGGVAGQATGDLAALDSSASVISTGENAISAAETGLRGLAIGPLTIGEVRSVASVTLTPNGTLTPTTSLTISGVKIGGLAVQLSTEGLSAAGQVYPVPLNEDLAHTLAASGITATFVAPQSSAGKVVAPALRIVFPFPYTVGEGAKGTSTATLTIGAATAAMLGSAASPGTATHIGVAAPQMPLVATSGNQPSAVDAVTGLIPTAGLPAVGAVDESTTPGTLSSTQFRPVAIETTTSTFDVERLYELFAIAGVGMLGAAQFIRLRAGGRPWN
jgi:hypothetical protein